MPAQTGYRFMDSKSGRNSITRCGLPRALAGAGTAMTGPTTSRWPYKIEVIKAPGMADFKRVPARAATAAVR
jgi:hypothetical protein